MSVTAIKPPLSYYGGKQQMLRHILPVIPEHRIYVEPFFGGGAVFWAKEPSPTEVVNDVNMNVVNFYEVLKHDYFGLRKLVDATLHSRETYKKALIIYECPWLFADDPVVRAWAFYVCCNQGFGSKVGTWGYDRKNRARVIQNKIDRFTEELSTRLRHVQIEQNAAHKVIASRDTAETFVYADPPYIDTDQGHYGGYNDEHFRRDLDALSAIEGKFLLSSFPSETLDEYVHRYGWHTVQIKKVRNAGNAAKTPKTKKVEVLTANYPIELGD